MGHVDDTRRDFLAPTPLSIAQAQWLRMDSATREIFIQWVEELGGEPSPDREIELSDGSIAYLNSDGEPTFG